ncbi:MAG: hypothetical protein JNK14_07710 [Chitinophagaceae bacterium]|nr:hypothetical protein [Chitinophagaceae bacterium]
MNIPGSFVTNFIAAIFIFLFTYTVVSKSLNIPLFIYIIGQSSWVGNYALVIAWSVISVECLAVILLFFPFTRLLGLYLSFAMMSAFTAYILGMLLTSSDLPCSCGGVFNELSWKQHLALNIGLIIIAWMGIRFQISLRNVSSPSTA